MRISLCMIVKDEEEHIVNCLDRALNVVDEAIIVDTGSKDGTKDLIRKTYGDDPRLKLVEHGWEDDFSKARNESIKHATGDWILVLDADERIFCNRQKLEDLIAANTSKAYIIPIYNIMDGDNIMVSSSMIRLYKNESPRYEGAIHEQILVNGEKTLGQVIHGNICRIYHYGYSHSVYSKKNKDKRNMDIIMDEIEREPNSSFHWYNKGVMEMAKGAYDSAMDDFIKSHNLAKGSRMSYHDDLVLRMIQCMIQLKQYKEAINFLKTVHKDPMVSKYPDLYYYWGIAYSCIKKYPLAIKNFKRAIEMGEYEKGISKFGIGSFLPKIEWAKILMLQKKKELAIEKYKEAVLDPHNIRNQGLGELRHILVKEKRMDEIEDIDKAIEQKGQYVGKPNEIDEFEHYKRDVKNNIKKLIEAGRLEESKELIDAYQEIVKDDIDIYSIKGVLSMMEGDMNRAEIILLEGIEKDDKNFDLLYNLAFIYQNTSRNELARNYYKRAIQNAENEDDVNEVYGVLKDLGEVGSKDEILQAREMDINAAPKIETSSRLNDIKSLEEYLNVKYKL